MHCSTSLGSTPASCSPSRAIVGEFVGAKTGIGVLILQANFGLDLASMFAVLVLIAVTGVVLNLILRLVETRLCFWSGKATK